MVAVGGEDTQVLVFDSSPRSALERALGQIEETDTDHVVGIAAAVPVPVWTERLAEIAGDGRTGRVIDVRGDHGPDPWTDGPAGFDVRAPTGDSLGDVGIAVIESLKAAEPERPAVVLDSAGALTEDPGTRFKFLTLLSHRLRKDDGRFVVLAGEEGLPEHEVGTLDGIFDAVHRDGLEGGR